MCYQSWGLLAHTTLSLISFYPHGTISLDFWNKMGSVVLPTLECWKIKSSSKSLERKRHKIVWPTFTRIIIDLTSSNWVFKLKLSKNRPTSLKTREKREKFCGFVCQINLCVNVSLEYAHVEICACSLSLGRNPWWDTQYGALHFFSLNSFWAVSSSSGWEIPECQRGWFGTGVVWHDTC